MLLTRLARELKNSVKSRFGPNTMFGFSRIRSFHCSPAPPETCFIMGRYGKIPFSGKRWGELDDVLQNNPILDIVPSDLLYKGPFVEQPWMTNDKSRYLLRSGLLLPYFSGMLGRSYSGAFSMDNVGVIRDLGVLAFRELNEDAGGSWLSNPASGYNEYSTFVNGVIARRHPAAVGFQPREMSVWIDIAGQEFIEEEFLVHHPAHLPDDEYGYMMIDLFKVLSQRYRQIGNYRVRMKIFYTIGDKLSVFLGACQHHAILNNFLPEDLRNPALVITPPDNAAGSDDYPRIVNATAGGPGGLAATLAKVGSDGLSGILNVKIGLAAMLAKTASGLSLLAMAAAGTGGICNATDGSGGPVPSAGSSNLLGTGGSGSIHSLPTIMATATAGGVPTGGPIISASGSTSAATGCSGGPAVASPSAGSGNLPGTDLPLPTHTTRSATARSADNNLIALGRIIVRGFRHRSVHSDEPELRQLLLFLPDRSVRNLENAPLGMEVIRLFRYNFPLYLPTACEAFWDAHSEAKRWEELELRRRNPIPSIYFAEPESNRGL